MPPELLHGLIWLPLTIAAWELSSRVYRRLGQPVWAPPMLVVLVLMVLLVSLTHTPYADYFQGTYPLHFLLGPATVALAVPLYHAIPHLRAAATPLLTTLVLGSFLCSGLAMALAWACGLSPDSVLAFATRAVTTPIAIGIAGKIHSPVALVSAIVIVSGLVGAMVAEPLLRGVRSEIARGFALGLAAHGVGTARAFQIHPTAGAFAALGMGLNGLFTAFWLPPVLHLLGH